MREIHKDCGGRVQLRGEHFRCSKCKAVCSVWVTRLVVPARAVQA